MPSKLGSNWFLLSVLLHGDHIFILPTFFTSITVQKMTLMILPTFLLLPEKIQDISITINTGNNTFPILSVWVFLI